MAESNKSRKVRLEEYVYGRLRPVDLTLPEDDYRKALELGQVLVAYARVMLVGPGGVGKSSLLRGFMNLPLLQKKEVNSTQLADLITVKPQQLMARATDNDKPWVEVTDDDEIDELVGLVLLVANVARGVTKSSRFRQYLELGAAYAVRKLREIHGQSIGEEFQQQISSIKNDVVREVFSRAIEQAKRNPHAQAPESEIMMNVWDCAGQSVYLDILSAFLTPKTIFMLLYDARKDLGDCCIILSHQRGQVTESQEQNMSYLEMLFQWMASIHVTLTDKSSVSIPEYPRIITIGTHGDDPQVKARKNEIIKELFDNCEGKAFTHLIGKGYVVNNKSAGRGDDEDPTFKELRKDVYQFTSQSSITIPTPVAWVLFRKILQKAAETKPILSRDEALEIAISCSIPPDSFDSVLKFYHDVAVFLYFDNINSLKDYVIARPQWLIKQLAKLLALEGFEECHNPALWNLLRKKGILVEALYKEVWKESGLPDKAIMDLLEKCCLATPINTKRKVHSYAGKEYFVPSALSLCSDNQLRVVMQNNVKTACTLHLLFNTRYVPPGYLTRLITALSRNKRCHISFSHGMYRNQFMFDFAGDEKNYIDEITISQHIMSVHVNVSRITQRRSHNPPFSIICREIMRTILECSSEIEQWLPSIQVSTAFTCDECSTDVDNHFIKFDPDIITTQSQLKCQENKICVFNSSQQYWLRISPQEERLDSEGVLTETEMQCIAEEIDRKDKCKELAETLEMTSRLQGDITARDLLQRWQSDMQHFGIHIKSHLIHHLRCINQHNTVERLKDGTLRLHAEKFKESAAEVEDILEEIISFSVSAISIDGLNEKKTLERQEYRLKQAQSRLKGLPEIKNDLQEKILQCEEAIAEKKEKYKTLREKLSSMKILFNQFKLWLEKAESVCRSLRTTMDQKQFHKAKAIIEGVENHKTNFNELSLAIQSVLDIVDDCHKPTLSNQLDEMTERFNTLSFNINDAVQRWLEDKETQLDHMASVIVLPVHIQKAKEFQRDINSFKLDMDQYKTQYETLKWKVAELISTLQQRRRWSLYGAATIIGFVAIMLGVLLFKPSTQSWNSLKTDRETRGSTKQNKEFFPQMYDRPTLNELLVLKGGDKEAVRIIERIGNQYYELCTYLLRDNHGSLLKTIEVNANGNIEAINREILMRWINGQGIKDVNWKILVQALRDGPKLNTLADDIVAALEANDPKEQDSIT